MMVHPQAFHPSQRPYPFMALPSHSVLEGPGPTIPLQDLSCENAPTQSDSTLIGAGHSKAIQSSSIPTDAVQNIHILIPQNQALDQILRNSSGQRVDPRVEALGWLVRDSRPRNICFEFHLHGWCTWAPTPCPRGHTTSILNIHQLNALQVLAKEVPCNNGNPCSDWKCCFGHRCPFGERCTKGKKCRFPVDMHITDLKVVNQQRPP